jgi:hypothetical protein
MDEQAPRIELIIHGRPEHGGRVPMGTMAEALAGLTGLLRQIAAERSVRGDVDVLVAGLGNDDAWLAVEGIVVPADGQTGREVVRTAIDGIAAIEQGEIVRDVLSCASLERLDSLARLVGDGAAGLVIRGPEREIALTLDGAHRVRSLLGQRFHSFGSVEGTIDSVSIAQTGPRFTLVHRLDGDAIDCRCDEELSAQANAALGARVRVSGTIARRLDGRIETIDVAEIRVLRGQDELPQVTEIRGLLAAASAPALSGSGPAGHE